MDGISIAAASPRVCLDFGTSFSKAGVFLGTHANGDACLTPLRLGAVSGAGHPYLTPTALYFEDARLHCGPKALMRARASVRAKRDPILSFKLLLSASDVEGTLALKLSPSVDPTRTMTYRDALVLYFAYLDQILRASILADQRLPNTLADAPLRLTSPLWRRGYDFGQTLSRLFHDAEAVSARLQTALISPDGACLNDARAALNEALRAPRRGRFAGIVTEAQAVAAAYSNFAQPKGDFLLVMDIGAGTTDIAGFRVRNAGLTPDLEEIESARQCCPLAGDEVDNAVIHQMLSRTSASSVEAKARVWRTLRLSARDLKHDLVERGTCMLNEDGRKIGLRYDALLKDSGFRDFGRVLVHILAKSMDAVTAEARRKPITVTVCLAGGGAHLPVVNAVIAEVAKRRRGKLKVITERFDYASARHRIAHAGEHFDKSFTQIVVALGGAIAELPQQTASEERAA